MCQIRKIKTLEDKNICCNNCSFIKSEDDDDLILEIRCQLNNHYEIKPDFFLKKRFNKWKLVVDAECNRYS